MFVIDIEHPPRSSPSKRVENTAALLVSLKWIQRFVFPWVMAIVVLSYFVAGLTYDKF